MTTLPTDPSPRTACGSLITDDVTHYPRAVYRGQVVYFCLRACQRVFEQDPDHFMADEIPHPTEEDAEA